MELVDLQREAQFKSVEPMRNEGAELSEEECFLIWYSSVNHPLQSASKEAVNKYMISMYKDQLNDTVRVRDGQKEELDSIVKGEMPTNSLEYIVAVDRLTAAIAIAEAEIQRLTSIIKKHEEL